MIRDTLTGCECFRSSLEGEGLGFWFFLVLFFFACEQQMINILFWLSFWGLQIHMVISDKMDVIFMNTKMYDVRQATKCQEAYQITWWLTTASPWQHKQVFVLEKHVGLTELNFHCTFVFTWVTSLNVVWCVVVVVVFCTYFYGKHEIIPWPGHFNTTMISRVVELQSLGGDMLVIFIRKMIFN